MVHLTIIIPCYHTPTIQLTTLLKSLAKQQYPQRRFEVILVEIASKVTELPRFPFIIRRVLVKKRIGYGEAANRGVEEGKGELVLLLNPDVILDESLLKTLVGFFDSHEKVGIVGPRIFSMDTPRSVSGFDLPVVSLNPATGSMNPTIPSWLARATKPFEVVWVSGSIILFKKSVWQKIGGFDERLFLYWEDADFCMRGRKAGFKTVVVPEGVAWHKGSASVGIDNPEKVYYLERNGLYFMSRHASVVAHLVQQIRALLLCVIKILKLLLESHERMTNRAFLLGVLDFYRDRKGKCPYKLE